MFCTHCRSNSVRPRTQCRSETTTNKLRIDLHIFFRQAESLHNTLLRTFNALRFFPNCNRIRSIPLYGSCMKFHWIVYLMWHDVCFINLYRGILPRIFRTPRNFFIPVTDNSLTCFYFFMQICVMCLFVVLCFYQRCGKGCTLKSVGNYKGNGFAIKTDDVIIKNTQSPARLAFGRIGAFIITGYFWCIEVRNHGKNTRRTFSLFRINCHYSSFSDIASDKYAISEPGQVVFGSIFCGACNFYPAIYPIDIIRQRN